MVLAAATPVQAGAAGGPAPDGPVSARLSPGEKPAALRRAAEQCGSGEICFWRDRDYAGAPWRWTPASGYRDMPSNLHDHVYSFYSNATGCFIDWDPAERRRVNPGDYAKAYDTNFGRRIDAVGLPDMC
ncbi:peptidase inhibitor family I36 protein [Sphaerisporangium sp. TRM90804]|uniref:peptidase inhibitor family I36 protein n=1 Tax=Sphaerisporangium sp. TRM90804 TaxID=3031113 RepID=UPI002449261C|nr:peptidase inhibitor family I36 protein [Sphaerisporangium sp. TRM90804]MDH2424193.1 peptidase inhibitor family I36 protein [Sphaerisporangium sp. TRM90804]